MANWRTKAACRTADPELWFPDKGDHGEEAKHICWTRCPVREPCLNYAIRNKIVHGIWGGYNYRDRTTNGRPAAALCPQGHALTADNTVRNGHAYNGDQAYRCRRCLRERRIRIREAQREKAS